MASSKKASVAPSKKPVVKHIVKITGFTVEVPPLKVSVVKSQQLEKAIMREMVKAIKKAKVIVHTTSK